MIKSGHTLRVIADGDRIELRILCHEPDGSPCRLSCPMGCEEACSHELVNGACNAAEWIDSEGVIEYHRMNERAPLQDGMPIYVDWTGEDWVWSVTES